MSNVVLFARTHPYPTYMKEVDGEMVEFVRLEALTPLQRAQWELDFQQELGRSYEAFLRAEGMGEPIAEEDKWVPATEFFLDFVGGK